MQPERRPPSYRRWMTSTSPARLAGRWRISGAVHSQRLGLQHLAGAVHAQLRHQPRQGTCGRRGRQTAEWPSAQKLRCSWYAHGVGGVPIQGPGAVRRDGAPRGDAGGHTGAAPARCASRAGLACLSAVSMAHIMQMVPCQVLALHIRPASAAVCAVRQLCWTLRPGWWSTAQGRNGPARSAARSAGIRRSRCIMWSGHPDAIGCCCCGCRWPSRAQAEGLARCSLPSVGASAATTVPG